MKTKTKIKNKIILSAISLLIMTMFSASGYSQSPAQSAAPAVSPKVVSAAANQVLYAKTDPDMIVKAYWALQNLDVKNNDLVDLYLMATECSLYQAFYRNDVEWARIRDATRDYITANKKTFPRRFEFVQPLAVTKYDPEAGGFFIAPNFRLQGVKKLQISYNRPVTECLNTSAYQQKLLPFNAILNIARPLNYTFVKASKANVEEYQRYLEENKIKSEAQKAVYIRYRVKVEQSLGTMSSGLLMFANFYGTVESISIFADRDLFIKLDEQIF